MAGILTHVLSCCLSRKSSQSRIQDEESHLIPANTEITPNYSNSPPLLGQTFRERMLDIVRSKESKMVNTAARLPFHFHKIDVSITSENEVSREAPVSRSASTSALPPDPLCSRPSLPRSPMYASRFRMRQTVSPSSSVTFPNDYSRREICPEDQGDERSISGSRARTSHSPAFNVRLVRGGSLRHHAADVSGVRRGRPRQKANSENDDSAGDGEFLSTAPPQQAQSPSQSESPTNSQVRSTILMNSGPGTTQASPEETVASPASTASFDIGPLVVSWDD